MEEKYKIHACYILGILITTIIILITIQWSGIPNLAEKISFALTLASLILAALAIGYAVYSNTSFTKTVTTLNNASNDVSATAHQISEAANELTKKIEAIPSRLESMESKVDQVLLRQVPEKQDTQPPNEKDKKAAEEIIDSFILRIPTYGVYLLYVISNSYSKQAPINLEEIVSSLSPIKYDFALGFLSATKAAGLINYKESKD